MSVSIITNVSEVLAHYNKAVVNVLECFKTQKNLDNAVENLQVLAEYTIRLLTGAELVATEDSDEELVGGIDSKEFANIVTVDFEGADKMHLHINNSVLAQLTKLHDDWDCTHHLTTRFIVLKNKDGHHYKLSDESLYITATRN